MSENNTATNKQFTIISPSEPWVTESRKPTPAVYQWLLFRLGSGPSVPDSNVPNIWTALNDFTGGLQLDGIGVVNLSAIQTLSNKALQGVTNGSNAAAGIDGEYQPSIVLAGSAVPLSTGSPADITTLELTAGDWDVWGEVVFAPAGSTTVSALQGWIGVASATPPVLPNGGAIIQLAATFTPGATQALPVGTQRATSNAAFTLYLSVQAAFGVSTMGGYGGLFARRRR